MKLCEIMLSIFLGLDERHFLCETCGKEFGLQEALDLHQKWHSTERRFVCDHDGCTLGFKLKKDLIRHKVCHSGTRPFKCSICHNAEFCRKDNLMRHVRIKHSLPASAAKGSVWSSQPQICLQLWEMRLKKPKMTSNFVALPCRGFKD